MTGTPYSVEHLSQVWARLRGRPDQRGAKDLAVGVDGMRADAFESRLTEHLTEISRRIQRRGDDGLPSYRFGPLLCFLHERAGGRTRAIHVARVRDQVVMRALHEDICAAALLHGMPRLNPPGPLVAFKALRALLEANPEAWVLRTDIRAFFDSVPRERVVEAAAKIIDNPTTRDLLRAWARELRARPAWRSGTTDDYPAAGLPQGLSLSASLAELWAARLDQALPKGVGYLRFVDDIVVVASSETAVWEAREVLAEAARSSGLELSGPKTVILRAVDGVPWLGMTHFPSISKADPERVDRWLRKFVGIRQRAARELLASPDPAKKDAVVDRFHAEIRAELHGAASWRAVWYSMAEDVGLWRRLDQSLHSMIRSIHRLARIPAPSGHRLPSIHRVLKARRQHLSASSKAEQGPCANRPGPRDTPAEQGPTAPGEAEPFPILPPTEASGSL